MSSHNDLTFRKASQSLIAPMDPMTKTQLLAVLATMSATLNNFIQITSTRNQRLDKVASYLTHMAREVMEESDSTTNLIGLGHRKPTQE